MHSSEKEYYCKECDEHFRGPSYFKHLKSEKHYGNYIRNRHHFTPDGEFDSDNPPFRTFSMDTGDPKSNDHALNFLRSMPQFLDMWYHEYHMHVSTTRSGIRVVLSFSKMDHK